MSTVITDDVIKKVAHLSRTVVPEADAKLYATQLESILEHFDSLSKVDTTDVEPTYQTTGLKTILRKDEVDTGRMFSQQQALSNSKKNSNGYFVTNATIKK